MRLIQVTLGATATRITTSNIYTPALTIQNNSANLIRIGDNTVSATRGIFIPATTAGGSGSFTFYRADNRISLKDYYIFGTTGSVIDIIYE